MLLLLNGAATAEEGTDVNTPEEISVENKESSLSTESREAGVPVAEKKSEAGIKSGYFDIPLKFSGYAQLWFVHEEAENGKQQSYTGDEAADETSGFSFNKIRLQADFGKDKLKGRMSVRFDGGDTASLLDLYGSYALFDSRLSFYAGQMKIPSAYEVEVSPSEQDFIITSKFSSEVTNWSLCKSPSSVSPFTNVQTYQRDTGIGVKGDIAGFSYFLMASNGLGANLFTGGPEKKEYVYTNKFGEYFYGARLSYDFAPLFKAAGLGFMPLQLIIGGHYNYNRHDNILYNDTKTVLDLKRDSYSGDVRLNLFKRIRLTGMYGAGHVDDDFDNDGDTDYEYSGWEAKCVAVIIPGRLETGVRYDEFESEKTIYGAPETDKVLTLGVTSVFIRQLRFQVNYRIKKRESPLSNDLDDNALLLQMQYAF